MALLRPEDTVLLHTSHPTSYSYVLCSVFSTGSYTIVSLLGFPCLNQCPSHPKVAFISQAEAWVWGRRLCSTLESQALILGSFCPLHSFLKLMDTIAEPSPHLSLPSAVSQ